jgi:hypothetical protein
MLIFVGDEWAAHGWRALEGESPDAGDLYRGVDGRSKLPNPYAEHHCSVCFWGALIAAGPCSSS